MFAARTVSLKFAKRIPLEPIALCFHKLWSWIKYELGTAVGNFVYPVILAGKLTEAQERKIRQIEPAGELFDRNFRTEASAPQGRRPIDAGSTWKYQHDKCPACLLTRVGSDSEVLCALYAGMIARFPIWKLATHRLILADLGVHQLESPKSKRVRLIRYWIRATTTGDAALFEAVELGILIKKKHKELQDENHRSSHQPSVRPRSVHHSSRPRTPDAKIGPHPRSPTITPHTPLEKVGFRHSGHQARGSSESSRPLLGRQRSNDTLAPHDSITTILTGERTYNPRPQTPTSGPTIVNLPGFPSRAFTSPSAALPPLAPMKARVSSSRNSEASDFSTILSYDNGPTPQRGSDRQMAYNFPKPHRHSVYGGFGYAEKDPFEDADRDEVEGEEGGKASKRSTKWSDLY
ncbi:hypothetical protein SNOG_01983 [Parastagonospora nodorum SN15]|uniref:Uncharacterized protein n=1 Tax=Phaeosphaeria nodorum (strain SN15 / ATCC MYA-4574 / FGSC 10173) TaxID=321614 RepID=Q0V1Y1_PHANO|nr:hypothetical protein SNOG_01983 [Parastagonospora nodorum SN15]EAT90195.1 hypothetical protein SNOG_01983 [Parastagonospora nodorum SN15]